MTILRNFEIDDFEDQVKDIIKRFNSKDEFVYNTSGSTGKPKKIVHSYSVMKQVAEDVVRQNNYNKDSYILNNTLPPTSIGFPVLSVLPALISGCRIRIKKFDPKTFVEIMTSGPTHMFILPSIYRVMKKTKKWKEADLSTIDTIACGADLIPENMATEVISKGVKRFKMDFGSTEVPPSITDSSHERKVGLRLSPLIDHYFGDDGELFVKWKSQSEYWQSGDLFTEDFEMIGRKKNILKLQGCTTINPETVEKYILDNFSSINRAILQIKDEKPHLYYEGDANENLVKSTMSDWFFSDNKILNVVKKVDKIEVNHMNKLVRTASYE
jgi:acyl-coenzyme A synthetase/AMP-(fatty) acid ligase